MTNRYLGIYLNDHLAGAVGGAELARRVISAEKEGAGAEFMVVFLQDIEEDRRELEALMDRLGIVRNPIKTRAAWAAEKVGRLKLNGRLLRRSPLSLLEELEVLQLGVEGKLAMWRALRELQVRDDRFRDLDLQRLIDRATKQRDE
ncbi:MAG TPA: hypothetical protein VHL78_01255, partial [Actinomycetota bacterium]|nr:hypothetical protein [Actinomycetota bacterium]